MRQKTKDNLQWGKAHYVQKDGKQQRACLKQCDSGKDNQRDSSTNRLKSCRHYKNIQCHYYEQVWTHKEIFLHLEMQQR